VRLLWLATILTAVALVPYFYQGWVQFGYRYLLDALPYRDRARGDGYA
jgi:hypothetical protein